LVDFDGHFTQIQEVEGTPNLRKTTLPQQTFQHVAIVKLK